MATGVVAHISDEAHEALRRLVFDLGYTRFGQVIEHLIRDAAGLDTGPARDAGKRKDTP